MDYIYDGLSLVYCTVMYFKFLKTPYFRVGGIGGDIRRPQRYLWGCTRPPQAPVLPPVPPTPGATFFPPLYCSAFPLHTPACSHTPRYWHSVPWSQAQRWCWALGSATNALNDTVFVTSEPVVTAYCLVQDWSPNGFVLLTRYSLRFCNPTKLELVLMELWLFVMQWNLCVYNIHFKNCPFFRSLCFWTISDWSK